MANKERIRIEVWVSPADLATIDRYITRHNATTVQERDFWTRQSALEVAATIGIEEFAARQRQHEEGQVK